METEANPVNVVMTVRCAIVECPAAACGNFARLWRLGWRPQALMSSRPWSEVWCPVHAGTREP